MVIVFQEGVISKFETTQKKSLQLGKQTKTKKLLFSSDESKSDPCFFFLRHLAMWCLLDVQRLI